MTPLQRDAAIALDNLAAGRAKLVALEQKREALANVEGEHVAAHAAARDRYRSVAGLRALGTASAEDLDAARLALRAAEAAAEDSTLAREGLAEVVSAARSEVAELEKHLEVLTRQLAASEVERVEAQILALAKQLGVLRTRWRGLCRLGQLPGASDEMTDHVRHFQQLMSIDPNAPVLVLADLLDAPQAGAKTRAA